MNNFDLTMKFMKVVQRTENFVSSVYAVHSYKVILRSKILVTFQAIAMLSYSLLIRLLCTDAGRGFRNVQ